MRVLRLAAVAVTVTLGLVACATPEPIQTPTPTPTPSAVIDTSRYIGTVVDPVGTVWSGIDSGGDLTTLMLHADGTLAVQYGEATYDYPGDTWRVDDGVLKMEIYLNETEGYAEYVGLYDKDTNTISAQLRTTRTAKQLTVTLARQQP